MSLIDGLNCGTNEKADQKVDMLCSIQSGDLDYKIKNN